MTSRISTPAVDAATGATAELFAQIKKAAGGVPNTFAAIGSLGPSALKSILQADGVLSSGTLGKQDLEAIKLIVSEVAGCDYCVAAHSMLGKMTGLKPEVLRHIRAGEPTGDAKRDALVRFVRNLQRTSGTISKPAFHAIKDAGYTDGQLVEISLAIAVTVFTNVFNRINDTTIDMPAV
ncbi:carboxymuconolactone decarboxylase family protein [Mesorhizobium sp. B2-3-5]|uniref:carboxymuconolactone decarboxylase family protein n=1 Tax=Mesorhizobium sp. B2-3-5 TaxID=2589958 RepID=UPI0011281A98|nr:carboxymuconolactone decarboxylase family protein [Mesorhizobium sp. B2-3-5]TPM26923.1 carboxymuconolactone decarboxylase family protein [Mesorhizobium sp. B2-3-5]